MNCNHRLQHSMFSAMVLALMCGCTAALMEAARVEVTTDDFEGLTKTKMSGNTLGCDPGESALGGVGDPTRLEIQRTDSKNGEVSYSIIMTYVGTSWLFIEPGESLVFLLDGRRMGFS